MNSVVYVCVGTCKAEISEEEYKGGLIKCGTEGCTQEGHEFEKRMKCGECGAIFKEGEAHSHQ
jgi:DNA-directed RNA polymerase subunit RPC12/RpoP